MICLEATASKINNLHFTTAVALYKNIFWFQVAVDETKLMNELQSIQTLASDRLQKMKKPMDYECAG